MCNKEVAKKKCLHVCPVTLYMHMNTGPALSVGKHECWESVLYEDRLGEGDEVGSILCKCSDAEVTVKYTTTPDRINVPSL